MASPDESPSGPFPPASALRRRPDLFICLGLFLLAAGLRLPGLDQGLWFDEIKSLKLFLRAGWGDLLAQPAEPTHQPFYALLAKFSLLLLGEDEWTIRLPAFLFGSATIPLLYLFGKRRFSPRIGLIAALFMSVAMWPVWFSQDARSYAPMIFFSLLATHDFLNLADSPPSAFSWRYAARYVASAGFAIYAHPYAGSVVIAHLLTALCRWRRPEKRGREILLFALPFGGLALAGLLYAPLFSELWQFTSTHGRITRTRAFSAAFVPEMFLAWSAGKSRPFLSLPLLAPAFIGLILVAKKDWRIVGIWIFSLIFGLAVPVAANIFIYHRFYTFDLPGYYLFAAAGLDTLLRRRGAAAWAGRALLAAAFLALIVNLGEYYREGKQAFRPAAEWVRKNAAAYRPLTVGLAGEVLDYYLPEVSVLPSGRLLEPAWLKHAVVIVSHPWSVGRENYRILETVCGKPLRLPSAGYEENEVRVYRCE